MTKKYVNENNLQTAMTEYQDNMVVGREVYDQYKKEVGTVTRVYDNTSGDGEQVYAVVKDPSTPTGQKMMHGWLFVHGHKIIQTLPKTKTIRLVS